MSFLIVGSSSGLGRELAYTFARNKKNLFLVSRDKRDLLPIKSDIEQKFSSKVEILELDFTSIKEIEQKLLSKKEIIDDLQGALFPIGLMFEEDDINLNIENATKLINAKNMATISPGGTCKGSSTIESLLSVDLFSALSIKTGKEAPIVEHIDSAIIK